MKHDVTIKGFFFFVLLCDGLPCGSHGQDDRNVWEETFRDGRIGGWVGYGGDSVCKIVKESTAKQNALMATFTDASSDAWAHRGLRIDFKKSISRDAFKYIHFDYRIDRPVKAIGYFLQDEENNMWRVFSGSVVAGRWARSVVKESAFKFGWGKKPPGNRASKIVRLYLFVETPNVNTGTQFRLFVDNVTLSKDAPEQLVEPIDAGPIAARERYLLLDSRLVESTRNSRLAVGTVTRHPANPLFGQELPWEQTIHHMYANVMFDEEDRLYKIWYFTTISGPPNQVDWGQHVTPGPLAPKEKRLGNFATCYAVSKDGIRWEKPALDVYRYKGKPTNIVVWGTHGTGVFKDVNDADPKRRYKRIAGRHPHGSLDAAFSADGIRWGKRFPIASVRGDTHNNALWAPELKKYVAFTREYPPPGIRTVLRMESEDFVKWSPPVEVLRGPIEAQTYSMPVFRYADIYLGLVAIYHTSGELHGRVTTELAWSPDTKIWRRIDEGNPLISLCEKVGDVNWGCIYAASRPVVLEDEIRIYYSGQKKTHDWNDGWLCLARLRRDGWAGYLPRDDAGPAVLVTNPILCDGRTMRVTADIRNGGSVKVTLLDDSGKSISEGLTLTTDVTDAAAADVSALQGERVRVRFDFRRAQVYSLRFVK
jgi:hypothetical protein